MSTLQRGVRRTLAAAVVALAVSLSAAGCTGGAVDKNDALMPSTAAGQLNGLATSAPLETPATTKTMPVYWLGHSSGAVYLYREFLPAPTSDDPIVAALEAMMTVRPHDPEYFSVWSKPSRLGASISAKNVITIDISSDAFAQKVDTGIAERSVAQLVYTATAAASMAGLIDAGSTISVQVLVDGHTGYDAFGHVPLQKPLTRNTGFVAPVWIIDPGEDTSFSHLPLKVAGQAMSPSGVLGWTLSPMVDGAPAAASMSGTVAVPSGPGELGSYSISINPPPGTYQLSVFIHDPADKSARQGVDTKTVTIAAR